jgi:transcriptional regulator with XRE-family HTH domain
MLRAVRKWLALTEARKRVKLRQEDVAAKLGVEQSAVSRWETGRSLPETETLIRLAVLLETDVNTLILGLDPKHDLLCQADRGSSSAARSQAQLGGPLDAATVATARLLAEFSSTYDAFHRAVSDVARDLTRLVEDAPAHITDGKTGTGKAGRAGHHRKVG